ncbi:hypothetical protein KEF29_03275 [Streptomyces tuirus]|uniref:Uncharacterized protein n=1 Tax=Streptomyces tuirus TaxID=68278 RepID=A0A941F8J0_9ACTN|nr:hypothetical protein [Streptomyces tuirus]
MRRKSKNPGRTDKQLAQRATAIGIVAMGTGKVNATADRMLHDEFTPEEMRRALAYIESGKSVHGR